MALHSCGVMYLWLDIVMVYIVMAFKSGSDHQSVAFRTPGEARGMCAGVCADARWACAAHLFQSSRRGGKHEHAAGPRPCGGHAARRCRCRAARRCRGRAGRRQLRGLISPAARRQATCACVHGHACVDERLGHVSHGPLSSSLLKAAGTLGQIRHRKGRLVTTVSTRVHTQRFPNARPFACVFACLGAQRYVP